MEHVLAILITMRFLHLQGEKWKAVSVHSTFQLVLMLPAMHRQHWEWVSLRDKRLPDIQGIFSVYLLYIDYSFGTPPRSLAEARDKLLFNLVSFQCQNLNKFWHWKVIKFSKDIFSGLFVFIWKSEVLKNWTKF